MGYIQCEPKVVKVLLIKRISGGRYELMAEVYRRNDGSIIELGCTKYCTGMTTGIEIFDISMFTEAQLAMILEGK